MSNTIDKKLINKEDVAWEISNENCKDKNDKWGMASFYICIQNFLSPFIPIVRKYTRRVRKRYTVTRVHISGTSIPEWHKRSNACLFLAPKNPRAMILSWLQVVQNKLAVVF